MSLIRCPDCKTQISDAAENCIRCGRPISSRDRQRLAEEQSSSAKFALGCGFIALLFMAWAAYSCDQHLNDPTVQAASEISHRQSEAKVYCEQAVRERLKAPSTANFPWGEEAVQIRKKDSVFIVTGAVDAQNSFGAQLRTSFACELKLSKPSKSGRTWKFLSVTVL